jgi:hypothetical protein
MALTSSSKACIHPLKSLGCPALVLHKACSTERRSIRGWPKGTGCSVVAKAGAESNKPTRTNNTRMVGKRYQDMSDFMDCLLVSLHFDGKPSVSGSLPYGHLIGAFQPPPLLDMCHIHQTSYRAVILRSGGHLVGGMFDSSVCFIDGSWCVSSRET